MLLPLKPGELQRLIPAVASGPQFSYCSGSPQQLLQRLLISSIGGVTVSYTHLTLPTNREV